jgi:hypothetical protein
MYIYNFLEIDDVVSKLDLINFKIESFTKNYTSKNLNEALLLRSKLQSANFEVI